VFMNENLVAEHNQGKLKRVRNSKKVEAMETFTANSLGIGYLRGEKKFMEREDEKKARVRGERKQYYNTGREHRCRVLASGCTTPDSREGEGTQNSEKITKKKRFTA